MANALDRRARQIHKEHNKPEAVKQRKNGAEEFRTRLLNNLHHRVGLCLNCGKPRCAGKEAGSTLPRKIQVDDLMASVNETASDCKLEAL